MGPHQVNINQKKVYMAVTLITSKLDFTVKIINRDKKDHFIMIKKSFIKKYIVILNVY